MKKLVALAVISLTLGQSWAMTPRSADPFMVAGGASNRPNTATIRTGNHTAPLEKKQILDSGEKSVADEAEDFFKKGSNLLSLVIVNRGKIIAEHYRYPARASSPMFSWSMSKSLTAYTIGQTLCDGNIASLDESAGRYAPNLKGTPYFESSIRHIMTMSSGAPSTPPGYSSTRPGQWEDIYFNRRSGEQILKEFPNSTSTPGTTFAYKNSDTLALGYVVEGAGGFVKQFTKFWNKVGADDRAYWVVGTDGVPLAAAGFSATARDWARAGLYIIDVHNRRKDSACFQDYVRDAHSVQIRGYDDGYPRAYGFQVWMRLHGIVAWEGHGGQRVFLDPKNDFMVIIFAQKNDHSEASTKLLYKWQKQLNEKITVN